MIVADARGKPPN